MQSTLRRRMMLHLGLMVSGSLLMGLGALLGINGLHDDLGVALQANQQLRQVYEVSFEVATARRELSSANPDQSEASTAIETAIVKLNTSDSSGPDMPTPKWLDESKRAECQSGLQQALDQLKRPSNGDDTDTVREAQLSAVNTLLGQLANLSADIRTTIVTKQRAGEEKRHITLVMIVTLFALVVFTAIAIGLRQYRSVMRPLNRMSQSVQNFASGKFDERIIATGDREFVSLANDFNFMTGELEGLYRQLEQKVAAKSKELVRSERLASVGYLAAGVAHEINNPLGIIAGYGERSLQHLARGLDQNTRMKTENAIKIICSEAFRCKEITDRLLSLARPGSDDRRRVSLAAIVKEAISNLGGLPEYKDRRITLQADDQCNSFVMAKEGEIRQVLVNLILNALEATMPAIGHVEISIRNMNMEVEISVEDNGRGMAPEIMEHVFEPFFTEKRGQQRPGTGLGLSITHAIVLDHGGRITAQSDGLGKGSRLILCLPAAKEGVEFANAE